MAMRCRCPPESFSPNSPMIVSYPSGNSVMKSWALAALAAMTMSSMSLAGSP